MESIGDDEQSVSVFMGLVGANFNEAINLDVTMEVQLYITKCVLPCTFKIDNFRTLRDHHSSFLNHLGKFNHINMYGKKGAVTIQGGRSYSNNKKLAPIFLRHPGLEKYCNRCTMYEKFMLA